MKVAHSHYWLRNENGDFYRTLLLAVIPMKYKILLWWLSLQLKVKARWLHDTSMKVTEKKNWHMKFSMVRDKISLDYEWWVWKSNNSDGINSLFKTKANQITSLHQIHLIHFSLLLSATVVMSFQLFKRNHGRYSFHCKIVLIFPRHIHIIMTIKWQINIVVSETLKKPLYNKVQKSGSNNF
jgi:hypothetical protein